MLQGNRRVFSEKLTGPQLVKKFLHHIKLWGSIIHSKVAAPSTYPEAHQSSPRLPTTSQRPIFNIVFPSMPIFLRSPHRNPIYTYAISHTCHMPSLSHFSWFDHPNIWWGVQIIKLLVRNLLQYPVTSHFLGLKIDFRTIFFEYPQALSLPECERPSFTPIQTWSVSSSVANWHYLNYRSVRWEWKIYFCCSWTAWVLYALAEWLTERSFLAHTKILILSVFLSKITEPPKLLPYTLYNQKVSYTKSRPHSEHIIDCDKTKLLTNVRIMASQMHCDSLLNTSKLEAAKVW